MEISIASVTGMRLSEMGEYDFDEEDIADEEEPYYRVLTIETESGTLKIHLEAMTEEALEIEEEDD